MLKRVFAMAVCSVMVFSCGCGLSSKTKNRIFGDKWATYHFTWAINQGNNEYLAELIKENKNDEDLLNDALTMALATTKNTKNRAFMVEQLIEAGADPNTKSSTGESLLITYLYNYGGCYDATAALLTSDKIDLNVKDSTGRSVLFNAMSTAASDFECSNYHQVKMLAAKGAKPTKELFQKSSDKNQAYENLRNSPYSTKYLLNAMLESGEESGLPLSLEYALLGNIDDAIKELEKSDDDLDEDQINLFVRYTMYWGTPEQFEKILNMWDLDFSKYKIYAKVAETNNVDMLKYLVKKFDLNLSDPEKEESVLDIFNSAAIMGSSDVCEYLSENKCITGTDYRPRKLLLSYALSSQDFDTFKIVYDYMRSQEEITEEEIDDALNNASTYRLYNESLPEFYYKIFDFLFSEGYTLENFRILNLTYDGYKYIIEKGRPVTEQDLFDAIKITDIDIFKYAVENGADVNSIDPEYTENGSEISAIQDAVGTGKEFVSVLIDNDAEIPDDIMKSTTNSSVETVKLLIDNGADTDIRFDKIPTSTKGSYKSGDYDLKDYWEAYGRTDLAELL